MIVRNREGGRRGRRGVVIKWLPPWNVLNYLALDKTIRMVRVGKFTAVSCQSFCVNGG